MTESTVSMAIKANGSNACIGPGPGISSANFTNNQESR